MGDRGFRLSNYVHFAQIANIENSQELLWRRLQEQPEPQHAQSADASTARHHGIYLRLQCCYCCTNLILILLVMGMIDLRTMALVMTAIILERLPPGPEQHHTSCRNS